jgi:hypothetical protein
MASIAGLAYRAASTFGITYQGWPTTVA